MGHLTAPVVREVSRTPYGSDAGDRSDPGDGSAGPPAPVLDRTDPERAGSGPDAVDDLGDEIATLAAHMHAAKGGFLALLARFDRVEGWKRGGHRSCARWLAYRTGLDPGTAREHVRVARALARLPETSRTMAWGALSFSQVRALTRVAKPETEADLLALAEGTTAAHLERVVRAWKRGSRREEAEWERARHRSRKLSVFPDDEGMYVVKGRLDPEVGALLMRALEAASDALYREKRAGRLEEALAEAEAEGREGSGSAAGAYVERDAHREAARRRADAVGLVAERALAAGFSGGGPEGTESESETEATCEHDCGCGPSASEAPISGTRAERYQVVLHVEPATLRAEEGPRPGGEGSEDRAGQADPESVSAETSPHRNEAGVSAETETSHLEDGTRLTAETARRLACDAGLVEVTHGPDGSVLDVGRKTRTIPPALRRALEVRDRGCRFPGCGLRFTDAHHLVHWADGGETSLGNTLLLCRHHHRLLHEEGWRVEWWGRHRVPAFLDPRRHVHLNTGWRGAGPRRRPGPRRRAGTGRNGGKRDPVAALPPDPVAALVSDNRARGAQPDPYTASPRWKRERDIPDEVLFRATEALL